MEIGLTTVIGLCADIILLVSGLGLALVILWLDRGQRSSQFFALCMVLYALYGATHAAWQVAQQFDLDPEPVVYLTSTTYTIALIFLMNFVTSFADLPATIRWIERVIAVSAMIVAVALLWGGYLYQDFEPLSNGSYRYTLTPAGLVAVGGVMVYLLVGIAFLQNRRGPRFVAVSLSLGIMLLGVTCFSLSSQMRALSLNSVTVTVAVMLLGYTVIDYGVYQPLADLTAELAEKNEQLAAATSLKSQFLANMSHELRTPLNSILGYSELVLARTYGDLNDKQVDRLQKVMRNGRLLLELINDVLDLSKIEAGYMDLEMVSLDTVALLNDVLDEFEPRGVEKGLSVVRGYGALPPLRADRLRARQMLANLVSNAIKFTHEGGVIVRGYYDDTWQQVVLSVTDTGVGIAPHQQEQVFNAFTQGEGSLSRHHEGTGLGLTITRRLAELHDGRLWFTSQVDQGSTFFLALPAAVPDDAPKSVILTPRRGRGPVILAIDDDAEALEVLQGQLEAALFRVWGARDPNDGLRLALDPEVNPALITLDVDMTGMDGWQVLAALRRDPATAAIPVLVISAADVEAAQAPVLADGFITRPVQPPVLVDHVYRLLDAAEQTREQIQGRPA